MVLNKLTRAQAVGRTKIVSDSIQMARSTVIKTMKPIDGIQQPDQSLTVSYATD